MKSKNQKIKTKINPKHIKAVIFDWGGVMCREAEPFASTALQEALMKTPDEIAAAIRPIYNDYYKGVYTRDEFWNAVLKHFKLMPNDQLNPAALSLAYRSSYEAYPRMFEFVFKLKSRYEVGLLSNLTPDMRDHIRVKNNLSNYFHTQVFSCDGDVRAMKPDAAIYLNILRKMNAQPAETLFIDNSQKNVDAALRLGIHALLFIDQDQCLKELMPLLDK